MSRPVRGYQKVGRKARSGRWKRNPQPHRGHRTGSPKELRGMQRKKLLELRREVLDT